MQSELPSDVDSCTELDLEDGVPEVALETELHDLQEVEQSLQLDVHQCAAYEVTRECRNCEMTWEDVEVVGSKPWRAQDFKQVVFDLYASAYEDRHAPSYRLLQAIAPAREPGAQEAFAELLNDAVTLGRRDATSDQSKRTQQEVLKRVLPA
jgi:hypothetical protein